MICLGVLFVLRSILFAMLLVCLVRLRCSLFARLLCSYVVVLLVGVFFVYIWCGVFVLSLLIGVFDVVVLCFVFLVCVSVYVSTYLCVFVGGCCFMLLLFRVVFVLCV